MQDEKEARLNYIRSRNLETELKGASVCWRDADDEISWDVDKCIFCLTAFTVEDCPETRQKGFRAGYVTRQEIQRWICELCFEDFKDYFSWKVTLKGDGINSTKSNNSFNRTLDRMAFIIKRLIGR
jgi:uncharacterized membrane-anchored protein